MKTYKPEEIIALDEKLRSNRSNWNSLWQDCADLILPNRASFTNNIVAGDMVHQKVYDTTAIWANEQLAAGLHGFVTPGTQRWLKLKVDDEELMERDEVRGWLDTAADIAYNYIYQPESNFIPMSHEMYLDIGALGTSVMYIEERINKRSPVRFHTFHLSECAIAENSDGKVDTLCRKFKWSCKKILERFPETAGPEILKCYEKNPQEEFELIHAVLPARSNLSKGLGFAFESFYILVKEKRFLSEGRFYEFPFATPRWSKITGELYGRSPGMTCLYDVRMINEMSRTVLKAAQKIVDPPLQMPDEGFLLPLKTTPGGINYYAAGSEGRIEPIITGGDIGLGLEMMNQRREQILRSFFLDSMKLQKENKEMTAYETAQRTEENMRAMSPMVGRLQSEGLGPMIERIISILGRQRLLPPAPVEIQEMDYQIEYISPVTRALKMSQLSGITRWIQTTGPLIQMKPEMLDKVDTDGIMEFGADLLDVPQRLVVSDAEVGKIRQQRAEAQAKAAQLAEAQATADVAATGGKAMESMTRSRQE